MMAGKEALGEELDRLTLENSILKGKNKELAKALSDKAIQCNELLKRSEELQNRLIDTEAQVSMFREGFKEIATYASAISPQFIKIVQEIEHMLEQGGIRTNVVNSPLQNSQSNETQAVQPMVSGHTISRTTIQLTRVTSESGIGEELVQHMQHEIEENIVYPRVNDEEDDATEIDEQCMEDNEIQVNNRLETLQEEDENQINEWLYQEELNETKMPEVIENTKSYDPLEGPSTLLDTTNNQAKGAGNFSLEPFRNCYVILNTLSPSRLVEHQLDKPKEPTRRYNNHTNYTNVRYNPTSTSSGVLAEGRPRQTTRSTKSLKEPAINKKMRR